uniref:Uncharacterized protein LOC100180559 n=1 Tax=Phallusia mammillata TaxID=59560 RepID=A0A6F9DHG5_9ASCI|nr:uncharacterized protein LOC100180559 [Phallusia mammillata]
MEVRKRKFTILLLVFIFVLRVIKTLKKERRMMSGFLFLCIVLLHVCTASPVQHDAAIAMQCGKNTQHRDVVTGQWLTDPSGNADCMSSASDMLAYCKKIYPTLDITNVLKETEKVGIMNWCSIGKKGPTCKGHPHAVVPVKCIIGSFQSPALQVNEDCQFLHVHNVSQCESYDYWATVANGKCQELSMSLQPDFSPLKPCVDIPDAWHGVEFVCCPSHKSKPDIVEVDPLPVETDNNPACSMPKDIGPCRASFDAFYFDTESGQCQHFIYGGCGGNANNFKSAVECANACAPSTIVVDPVAKLPVFPGLGPVLIGEQEEKEPVDIDSRCFEPKLVGMCKAFFRRWYYDVATGQCSQFVYGGCGANRNNFVTEANCQSACQPSATTTQSPPTTTTTTEEVTATSDYFGSPLDVDHEHELYIQSVQQELKDHQAKLTNMMTDWDAANSQLLESAITDPKGITEKRNKLEADLQRTKAALVLEHNQKQEQLSSLHEARMDAVLVKHRQTALHNYMQQLNADIPDISGIFSTLQKYIRAEKKDHEHTRDHIKIQPEDSEKLQARLNSIEDRISNTIETLQEQYPEIYSDLEDDLSSFMDSVLPSFSFEMDIEIDSVENQPIIDEGGLPAEENNEDEYYDSEEYEYSDEEDDEDGEEYDDDGDEDEFDVYDEDELEGTDEDEEDAEADVVPDENEDTDTDVDNGMVAIVNDDPDFEPDTDEYFDVESDDDDEESENGEPVYVNSAAIMNYFDDPDRTSETAWLKWAGIAGAGLLLLICIVAVVHHSVMRRKMSHQFTKIKVDDHLTNEERQLLQMQQNGYENPTYKFFEQQQMA